MPQQDAPHREADLTARARIREAAITCFTTDGFGASFTTIAKRAGVSPGLITHHFRSKAALREECDAEVLRRYQALKTGGVANPTGFLVDTMGDPNLMAPLLVYILRAIHAGGRSAQEFLEHLVDAARVVMKASVDAGIVRPSLNEEARLRYLITQAIGALLVELLTTPDSSPDEFFATALASQRAQALPILELFTEGLFTTRQMLDDYLDYVGDPPGTDAEADNATA
ncbi:TetR family transcriptional regulator [Demequina sp. TTPB684]|uniref:TetR/AcrR family transcriptional regulator n=1 Tax=unclassified Demequina TaxID=2620311 RepID=UPI001CF0DB00|nr:TetR family transcriptional regulator [Demequina sp. TMPB413]MCB2412753.1 TetR family transcriptional regulator [Demequina sp. TTPB684]UPU88870.1 TetR family transcriptional regulator [Demequina sp. TMPB413]